MSEELEQNVLKFFKDVQKAEFGNSEWFFLLDLAQRVSLISGFQYLLSTEDYNFSLFPHQEDAVLQVLQNMQGSALLADEVGLGKTIITLSVLSELKIRNLVDSFIIITPSSLINQWHNELIEKFNLDIPIVSTGRGNFNQNQYITTINLATRYSDKIISNPWDMVIIDEAHRVKNRKSKGWKFLNQLKKKYMLLLTATPMENYLKDIFSLTTLMKPIFGSYRQFRKEYSVPNDKRACKNPIQLRRELNQIMIRRKREEIQGIFFPERIANTIQFEMDEKEWDFYNSTCDYISTSYDELEKGTNKEDAVYKEAKNNVRNKYNITSKKFYNRKIWLHKFTLILLQRRICSSVYAADKTILNMINSRNSNQFDLLSIPILEKFHKMAESLNNKESSKLITLKKILNQIPNKCVIFTEFKDTLDYISEQLKLEDYSFIKFSGDLSSSQRAETIKKFWEEKDILLSTDAGSEGINLQVANTIINFDLPWNPMRIEQRIGRVYRLTQKSDKIYIFNLASKNTIEQYVLDLLYKKIGVFRTILGDLNHILGSLVKSNADGRSTQLEGEIMKYFVKHGHSEKLRNELEKLIQPVVDKITIQEKISENVLDVDSLIEKY
ncbi:MAG: DEAD/DEAH box helicase [Candidatus Hermodarchaeota archaeon]